jgi:hypothetical protein
LAVRKGFRIPVTDFAYAFDFCLDFRFVECDRGCVIDIVVDHCSWWFFLRLRVCILLGLPSSLRSSSSLPPAPSRLVLRVSAAQGAATLHMLTRRRFIVMWSQEQGYVSSPVLIVSCPTQYSNRGPLSSRLLHNNDDTRKTGLDQPRHPNKKEKEGKNAKKHLRRHPLPLIPVPIPRRPLLPRHLIPPGH